MLPRMVIVAGLLVLGACRTAPPAGESAALAYEGDPAIADAVRDHLVGSDDLVCRTERPTGSHREQRVCVSRADDLRQREMARRMLDPARHQPLGRRPAYRRAGAPP
jgi:hypothetical protein